MLWGSANVNWSSKDTEKLVAGSLSYLEERVGDKLYIATSRSHVVTKYQAQLEVDGLLKSEESTSIGLIATLLDLDREIVQQLIKASDVNFYIYGDSIVGECQIRRISSCLKESLETLGFAELHDICTRMKTDFKVCEQCSLLLEKDGISIAKLGDVMVLTDDLSQFKIEIVDQLNTLQEPAMLTDIKVTTPYVVFRELFSWLRTCKDLNGSIDAQGCFIPSAFQQKRARDFIEQLERVGTIQLETKDQRRWLKESNVPHKIVDTYAVTESFINKGVTEINQKIHDHGWAKVHLGVTEELVLQRVSGGRAIKGDGSKTEYIVDKRISDKVTDECRTKLNATLAADADQLFNSKRDELVRAYTNNFEFEKLCNIVNRSTLTSIVDLPGPVSDFCLAKTASALCSESNRKINTLVKSTCTTYLEGNVAKVLVYLNGVQSIDDIKLRSKLEDELLQYANSKLFTNIGTLEELEQHIAVLPRSDVHLVKVDLTNKLESRLEASSSPALTLHLAVLIAHGQISSNDCLLRATGKHVPKILKLLINKDPSCALRFQPFIELKEAVQLGDTAKQKELTPKVKEVTRNLLVEGQQ